MEIVPSLLWKTELFVHIILKIIIYNHTRKMSLVLINIPLNKLKTLNIEKQPFPQRQ